MPKVFRFANNDGESIEAPGRQTAALNELTQLRATEVKEHMTARRLPNLFETKVNQPAKYVNGMRVLKQTPVSKINRSQANIAQAEINRKKKVLNADDKGLEVILCEMMSVPENEGLSNSDLNMLFSKKGHFYGRENLPKEVLTKLSRHKLSKEEKEDIEYLLSKEGPTQPLRCEQEPAVPTKFLTGNPDLNAAFLANVAKEEANNAAMAAAATPGRRRPVPVVASHGGASRKKKMNKRKRTTRKH